MRVKATHQSEYSALTTSCETLVSLETKVT